MFKRTKAKRVKETMEKSTNLESQFWDKHWLFQHSEGLLSLQYNPIISYLDSTADGIKKKEDEIQESYRVWKEQHAGTHDPHDAYDLFESDLYDHAKFGELLNSSTLVTIYSMFESNYYHVCQNLKLFLGSKIDVNDLRSDSNIGQCRVYITKVGSVDLSSLDNHWNHIKKYQYIRNRVVHDNSRIIDIKSDMESFIKNSDGVEYMPKSKTVKIRSIEFLKKFIEVSRNYLVGVNNEIIKQTG
ncbi:MAG: hypothetical protein WBG48_03400 [Pricia sp.]